MEFHDAYARKTPVEVALPDPGAAELLDAIEAETVEAGVDPGDWAGFVKLQAVSHGVARLLGPGAQAPAVQEGLALVYHLFHFLRGGKALMLLTEGTAREIVGRDDERDEAPEPPVRAGYLQLPRHLFWTRVDATGPAEAVDGFFWTLDARSSLHVLLVAGMREDRPGFAVVPLPDAPWSDAARWWGARVRPDGVDFETTLPGGELDGLYSFEAAGEVLKLLVRALDRSSRPPRATSDPVDTGRRDAGPTPSSIPFLPI